jgi:hypothetical protein
MRYRWNDAPVGRPRMRAYDASAGAPGERRNGAAPTAGGANPEEQEFDQARRRVRLRGVDQEGQPYGAEVWLPDGGQGYGGDRKTGDNSLLNLVDRDPFTECSGLRAYQRLLDRHYGK